MRLTGNVKNYDKKLLLRWFYGKKKWKNFENFKILFFFIHFQLCSLRWAASFSSKNLRKTQILGFKICSINFSNIKMFRILIFLQLSCYLVSLWCVFFIRKKGLLSWAAVEYRGLSTNYMVLKYNQINSTWKQTFVGLCVKQTCVFIFIYSGYCVKQTCVFISLFLAAVA